MFDSAEYQLLDFGGGRKLERFGPHVVDRPSPAAEGISTARPQLWSQAAARFEISGPQRGGSRGHWVQSGVAQALPAAWTIGTDSLRFELKPTDFGHLGIFPEQADNWRWITEQVGRIRGKSGERPKMLNLFASTGGSTLAAAAAGAEVVHVDSSASAVAWARRNAELSQLASAPVRWIVEDAIRFVRREIKRGNRYNALILDPPSYGHGPSGEVWKLADDLDDLLHCCAALTADCCQFVLLTCHSPGVTPTDAGNLLAAAFETAFPDLQIQTAELVLESPTGRFLPAGVVARWENPRAF